MGHEKQKEDSLMEPISLNFSRKDSDTLFISLAGNWKKENRPPDTGEVEKQLEMGPQVSRILFNTENLTGWDSILLTFLSRVRALTHPFFACSGGLP